MPDPYRTSEEPLAGSHATITNPAKAKFSAAKFSKTNDLIMLVSFFLPKEAFGAYRSVNHAFHNVTHDQFVDKVASILYSKLVIFHRCLRATLPYTGKPRYFQCEILTPTGKIMPTTLFPLTILDYGMMPSSDRNRPKKIRNCEAFKKLCVEISELEDPAIIIKIAHHAAAFLPECVGAITVLLACYILKCAFIPADNPNFDITVIIAGCLMWAYSILKLMHDSNNPRPVVGSFKITTQSQGMFGTVANCTKRQEREKENSRLRERAHTISL